MVSNRRYGKKKKKKRKKEKKNRVDDSDIKGHGDYEQGINEAVGGCRGTVQPRPYQSLVLYSDQCTIMRLKQIV